jgi:hypothetical protein
VGAVVLCFIATADNNRILHAREIKVDIKAADRGLHYVLAARLVLPALPRDLFPPTHALLGTVPIIQKKPVQRPFQKTAELSGKCDPLALVKLTVGRLVSLEGVNVGGTVTQHHLVHCRDQKDSGRWIGDAVSARWKRLWIARPEIGQVFSNTAGGGIRSGIQKMTVTNVQWVANVTTAPPPPAHTPGVERDACNVHVIYTCTQWA